MQRDGAPTRCSLQLELQHLAATTHQPAACGCGTRIALLSTLGCPHALPVATPLLWGDELPYGSLVLASSQISQIASAYGEQRTSVCLAHVRNLLCYTSTYIWCDVLYGDSSATTALSPGRGRGGGDCGLPRARPTSTTVDSAVRAPRCADPRWDMGVRCIGWTMVRDDMCHVSFLFGEHTPLFTVQCRAGCAVACARAPQSPRECTWRRCAPGSWPAHPRSRMRPASVPSSLTYDDPQPPAHSAPAPLTSSCPWPRRTRT